MPRSNALGQFGQRWSAGERGRLRTGDRGLTRGTLSTAFPKGRREFLQRPEPFRQHKVVRLRPPAPRAARPPSLACPGQIDLPTATFRARRQRPYSQRSALNVSWLHCVPFILESLRQAGLHHRTLHMVAFAARSTPTGPARVAREFASLSQRLFESAVSRISLSDGSSRLVSLTAPGRVGSWGRCSRSAISDHHKTRALRCADCATPIFAVRSQVRATVRSHAP